MKEIKISCDLYNQIVSWNCNLWRLENGWKVNKKISKEDLYAEAKRLLNNIVKENDDSKLED